MLLEEVKTLQVGQQVCCCDFKHRQVAQIIPKTVPCWPLYPVEQNYKDRLAQFLAVDCALVMWLPVGYKTYELLLHMLEAIWYENLIDHELIFKDGFSCSALKCCEIIDDYPHDCVGDLKIPEEHAPDHVLAEFHSKFQRLITPTP